MLLLSLLFGSIRMFWRSLHNWHSCKHRHTEEHGNKWTIVCRRKEHEMPRRTIRSGPWRHDGVVGWTMSGSREVSDREGQRFHLRLKRCRGLRVAMKKEQHNKLLKICNATTMTLRWTRPTKHLAALTYCHTSTVGDVPRHRSHGIGRFLFKGGLFFVCHRIPELHT